MSADAIARRLDLVGLKCPYPVLRTQKALPDIPVGARLEVVATDPMASLDLKHFCQQFGHEMEDERIEGDRRVFVIRRGC